MQSKKMAGILQSKSIIDKSSRLYNDIRLFFILLLLLVQAKIRNKLLIHEKQNYILI